MTAPRVSVVVVTWNGLELLQRFLPSVLATDYPDLEVVLADNASADGTAAWAAEHAPGVRVVEHAENLLFAEGNNAAVPHATGELLLFLNNDVEVPPGWLWPLVRALEADPRVAAVQPKLLQHGDRSRFEYAGAAGGFVDAHGFPFTRGRLFDTLERDAGQYDAPRDVVWATGAALLVRREAFAAAGGFDASFGMHMEEIDLCWRLWRRGWRVRAEPRSEAYHLGGASLPRGPRKTYLNHRNSLLMLRKNLPAAAGRRALRARRALDAVAAARALASGARGDAQAIRRAWTDARARIPTIPPAPGGEPAPPLYRGSVVADYFLRRRRQFSDLPADRFDTITAPSETSTSAIPTTPSADGTSPNSP